MIEISTLSICSGNIQLINNSDKSDGNTLLLSSQATEKNQKSQYLNVLNHETEKERKYVVIASKNIIQDQMKHAYLIMAHNNFEGLKKLLMLIDDSRNDIYIHIDRKVKNAPIENLKAEVHKSSLVFVKPVSVAWGGYSQIKAELVLLRAATKNEYAYYHLLSGNDLPLCSQDRIHAFFEEHEGAEYISLDESAETGDFSARVNQYHFLQDFIGRNKGWFIGFLDRAEEISLKCQKSLGVNRQKKSKLALFKGGQWFSITDNMARYVLQEEAFIRKNFCFGFCVDEMFLQTVAMRSPYKTNVTRQCLRYIDWNRGCPYTFTAEDFELLIESERLFARKFDYDNQPEIVEKIVQKILQNKLHSNG